MVRLSLALLGGFEVRPASGSTALVLGKKIQALLAILAVRPGQAHARDRLASLLWADVGADQARHSVRQALFSLRRSLPEDVLRATGESVAMNPAAVDVDVVDFERMAPKGNPGPLHAKVPRAARLAWGRPEGRAHKGGVAGVGGRAGGARGAGRLRGPGRLRRDRRQRRRRRALPAQQPPVRSDPHRHRDALGGRAGAGRGGDAQGPPHARHLRHRPTGGRAGGQRPGARRRGLHPQANPEGRAAAPGPQGVAGRLRMPPAALPSERTLHTPWYRLSRFGGGAALPAAAVLHNVCVLDPYSVANLLAIVGALSPWSRLSSS